MAEIKAAYMYNFGRYFEFPETAFQDEKAPFIVAAVGPTPVDEFLATFARTKTMQNRPIVFRRYQGTEEIGPCHLLFISERLDDTLEAKVASQFAASAVVIVGEGEGFLSRGGTISFVIAENKVRLKISKKAAYRAGLKPSSKLLQVADVLE